MDCPDNLGSCGSVVDFKYSSQYSNYSWTWIGFRLKINIFTWIGLVLHVKPRTWTKLDPIVVVITPSSGIDTCQTTLRQPHITIPRSLIPVRPAQRAIRLASDIVRLPRDPDGVRRREGSVCRSAVTVGLLNRPPTACRGAPRRLRIQQSVSWIGQRNGFNPIQSNTFR